MDCVLPEVCSANATLQVAETDVGLWPEQPTADMLTFWSKNDSSLASHIDANFAQSFIDDRGCTKNMFIKNKSNGEKSLRQWLCYSPSKYRLYCFPCKLLCYQSKTFVSVMHQFNCHS